jgi:hypothetical protein
MASSPEDSSLFARSGIDPAGWCGGDQAGVGRHEGGVAQAGRGERYGPLTIARNVKRDGRALILFTCAEETQQT